MGSIGDIMNKPSIINDMVRRFAPSDTRYGQIIRFVLKFIHPSFSCLGAYHEMKYNMAVRSLLSVDVLNEHIVNIKALAESEQSPKLFYIIRREADAGLFSFVHTSFAHLMYALTKGMIPVIDMQNYRSVYIEEDKLGKENAWEYFFKQPCGYGLDDARRSEVKHGYLHSWQSILPLTILQSRDKRYNEFFEIWSIIYRHFFQLSDNASKYINEEYNRLIKPGMRVIGVKCRGTDYTMLRPRNHPIQPEVEDVIAKVREVMEAWNCDYVYISSEERKTVEHFEQAFPGKVLYVSQMFYDDVDYINTYITRANFGRENDAYLRGLEYLSSIIILARCTSAILSLCGGSATAMYINGGKYENTYIFDLGLYP